MFFATAIIFVVMFCVSYYIFSRILKAIEYFYKKPALWFTASLSLTSSLIIVLGFFRSMIFSNSTIKSVLGAIFSYWLGIFMYLFMFVVIADVIYLFVLLFKSLKSKRRLIRAVSVLCAVVLAFSVSVYGFYHATIISEKTYNVDIGLKQDKKIVLVSDLHLGAQKSEDRLTELVETINKQNADIVCVCGDIFDNDYSSLNNPEQVIDTLKRIQTEFGVYVVLGNHDAGNSVEHMRSFIEKCGFVLLEEGFVTIDDSFVLVGRADPSPIGGSTNRLQSEQLLSSLPDDKPIVVMDHNPHGVSEYKDKAELVLSGHTHKGQCFPGSILTSLIYEVDYGYGITKDNVKVVVTSGFGTWGMPMRVGTDSEIVSINLK